MTDSLPSPVRILGESLLSVALTIGAGLILGGWLSIANLAFLFLAPVILMAGSRGLFGGLVTALFATLAFNILFVPPTFTLRVADVDNLVTLAVFALSALLASHFAARLRAQAQRAEGLAQTSARLAELTQDLAACATIDEVCALVATRVGDWTGARLRFLDVAAEDSLSPLDAAAARWSRAHDSEAGRGTDVMAGADALYLPVEGASTTLVAQLWRGSGGALITAGDRDLVRQALIRTAATLQRIAIRASEQQAAVREAVLASVGHDLRTPLTGIMAGLAALPQDEAGILDSTRAEAARLDRLVTNIIDLARLRSDAVPAASDTIDLTDAIDAATTALTARLSAHRLSVSLPPDLPLVRSDARMLHHMLINLVDNAAKFSPAGSLIAIAATAHETGVTLSISDEGRGLPHDSPAVPRRDPAEPEPGNGLGLTVVTGFARTLGIGFATGGRPDGHKGALASLHFSPALCLAPQDSAS